MTSDGMSDGAQCQIINLASEKDHNFTALSRNGDVQNNLTNDRINTLR